MRKSKEELQEERLCLYLSTSVIQHWYPTSTLHHYLTLVSGLGLSSTCMWSKLRGQEQGGGGSGGCVHGTQGKRRVEWGMQTCAEMTNRREVVARQLREQHYTKTGRTKYTAERSRNPPILFFFFFTFEMNFRIRIHYQLFWLCL